MITFLKMEKSHIPGMTKVEEECFNSGFAAKTFEKELENKIAIYFVALCENKVLGYAGLWNICGTADIIDVAVGKDFRRQGIAEALLKKLFEECGKLEIKDINLEVRKSNEPAIALYKKLGFCENGLRKRYYENKEDAILMQKVLKKGETNENSCN